MEAEPMPVRAAVDIGPVVEDAAGRIVSRELLGIGARVGRCHQDPREFREWASVWFVKHVDAVTDTLTPIALASGVDPATARPAAETYCRASLDELLADPVGVLAAWRLGKPARVATIIRSYLEA